MSLINVLTKMEDPRVQQLANTLKNQGLAASMYEAIEKAKSILNVPTGPTQEESQQDSENQGYDITKESATLNELMEEIGVTPEQIEAQKQEKLNEIDNEIFEIKKDIQEAEKNPEKMEQVKEEIEKVKDEIGEIKESKAEEPKKSKEQPEEEDMFEEERKIDLTKVFNYKN